LVGADDGRLREVLGSERPVIRHQEVAPRTAVVRELDRDSRQYLLLYRDPKLPVVRPGLPAAEQRRINGRGTEGLTEVRVGDGTAQVRADLLGRIVQVAIGVLLPLKSSHVRVVVY
jgi:hypothetical protein